MQTLDYILLAVDNPLRSAELYDRVLGTAPVDRAPTFVLYILPNGMKVGLWSKSEMQPPPTPAGGVEISFTFTDKDELRAAFRDWTALGLRPLQAPTEMDFGFTCVAVDPDGHRLRSFVPAEQPR